ncbi:MAG: 2-oxoacid:acceptor oxidoreductase family protein [Candidatus Aenigmarchaeota archaeon]|nr:2-oxoacid:acceptor oxidoreductase family protein [Candidatus Aenigmarchaeota archaeon]
MIKIRFNGRGGQGAKTAAQLLVEAAITKGKYIQAFPEYGPERRGAPVKAFAKIDDKPIVSREPIDYPDVVVVIDSSLFESQNLCDGLDKKKGILIINTPKSPDEMRKETGFDGKLYTVNASQITLDLLKVNLPNTPMLGALIKVTGIVTIKDLENSIKIHFEKKIGKEKTQLNIDAIQRAYDEVK